MAKKYSLDLESGSSQYASIADGSQTGLDLSADMTLEMWVKLESNGATQVFVAKGQAGTNDFAYQFGIQSTDKLTFLVSSGGTSGTRNQYETTSTYGDTGVWQHWAMTWDDSSETCKFFVNGVEVASSLISSDNHGTGIYNSSEPFTVGRESWGGTNHVDGKIKYLRVFSDVRTQSEVIEDMFTHEVTDGALEGEWLFDNAYTDGSGNGNTLTASGSPTFKVDIPFDTDLSSSLSLEESNSDFAYIEDGDHTGLDLSGDMTLEGWFKFEQLPSVKGTTALIAKDDGGSNRSYLFMIDSASDKMAILYWNSAGSLTRIDADEKIKCNTGEWIHLAMSLDVSAQSAEFYINGVAVGGTKDTGSGTDVKNTGVPFCIGARADTTPTPSLELDGQVYDVRVWSDIRTAGEIADNFQATLDGDEAGLVSNWLFSRNLNDQHSNGNHLVWDGEPTFAIGDTPQQSKLSLQLEAGDSDYLTITDASQTGLDISGDLTFMAWVRPESLTGDHFLINKGQFSDSTMAYLWWIDTNGKVVLRVSDDGSNSAGHYLTYESSSGDIVTGKWQHVAVTFDISAETFKLYIDGKDTTWSKIQGTTLGATLYNSAGDVYVGARRNSGSVGSYWDGLLKDVRMYDAVLTQSEIITDAHKSDSSHADLIAEWNFEDGDFTDSSGNSNTLTKGGTPQFSADVPFVNATGIESSPLLLDSLQAYWSLDESSGDRYDTTAKQNHLTDTNTVGSTTGKKSNSADFEKSNSERLVVVDSDQHPDLDILGDLAISGWFQIESSPSAGANYFLLHRRSTYGYGVRLNESSGTERIYLDIDGASGLDTFGYVTGGLSTGTWYHLVVTWDASASKGYIYLDGQLVAVSTGSNTAITTSAITLCLGSPTSQAGDFFDGLLDEMSVHSKLLHYGDVLDLYNAGSAIAYEGSVSVTPAPATQSITFSIPTYTPSTEEYVTVTPSTQVITFSIPTYSVDLDWVEAPTTQSITFNLVPTSAIISGDGVTLMPSTQGITFTIPTYSIDAGGNITLTPATQSITFSIPSYSQLFDNVIAVNTQSITFSIPTYAVTFGQTISPSTLGITFSIPTETIITETLITPSTQVITFSIPTYTATGETAIAVSTQVITFSIPTATIVFGSVIQPDTQVITFTVPTLAKVGGLWRKNASQFATSGSWDKQAMTP